MQKLVYLILIIPLSVFANWQELTCEWEDELHANGKRYIKPKYIKTGGYKLRIGGITDCGINIDTNDPSIQIASKDSRSYRFTQDGQFYIFSTARSQITDEWIKSHWKYKQLIRKGKSVEYALDYMRTSDFHTTGSKMYTFHPIEQKQRFYHNPQTNELKVVTANGMTIYIDPKTGLIDEQRTSDMKVRQKPLAHYKDVISISSPKKTIVSTPFSMGGYNFTKKNGNVYIERDGASCKLQQQQVFDYIIECSHRSGSPCKCKSEDKFRNARCTLPASKISGLSKDSIDGTQLKSASELNKILSKVSSCKKVISQNLAYSPTSTPRVAPAARPQLAPKPTKTAPKAPASTPQPAPDQRPKPKPAPVPKPPKTSPPVKVTDTAKAQTDELICQKKLKEYFNSDQNQEMIQDYMKIQGKISLHRLAWTYLKMSQQNTKQIEGSIKELLKERDPELHTQFINSEQKSRNKNLLVTMQLLKEESKTFVKDPSEKDFALHYSDVKMIELLARAEEYHGRAMKSGVMDFTSIIKNSLKTRQDKKAKNIAHIQKTINKLTKKSNEIEKKVRSYLESVDCDKQVDFIASCKDPNLNLNIGYILNDSSNIVDYIYEDKFDKKDELKEVFKWNTYWLHVTN